MSGLDTSRVSGEVDALAESLDMLKKQGEDFIKAYKHAVNRKTHLGDQNGADSFDPAVS